MHNEQNRKLHKEDCITRSNLKTEIYPPCCQFISQHYPLMWSKNTLCAATAHGKIWLALITDREKRVNKENVKTSLVPHNYYFIYLINLTVNQLYGYCINNPGFNMPVINLQGDTLQWWQRKTSTKYRYKRKITYLKCFTDQRIRNLARFTRGKIYQWH